MLAASQSENPVENSRNAVIPGSIGNIFVEAVVSPDLSEFCFLVKCHFTKSRVRAVNEEWLAPLESAVHSFFDGDSSAFMSVPYRLRNCTAFQEKVLRVIAEIPYGETRSYAWVARKIHKESAHRAVALACKHNPLQLVIPCHRVVRSDGTAGGYQAGSDLKEKLLLMESGGSA
jgi:methylated-DNA-[protein]-cysteine S-methyltransferase